MNEQQVRELLRGEFTIDIPNFKKWNPDSRHRRTWFALAVDFNQDPKVERLSMADRGWWIYLLAQYARSPSTLRGVTASILCRSAGATTMSPGRSLLKMWKSGLIILRSNALQTDITDKTDTTDEEEEAPSSASPVARFASGTSSPPEGVQFDPNSTQGQYIPQTLRFGSTEPVDHRTSPLLSERGEAVFRRRLGSDYESEFEKCVVYWESQGYGRKPFPVVFGRWCDQIEKAKKSEPKTTGLTQEEWDKIQSEGGECLTLSQLRSHD